MTTSTPAPLETRLRGIVTRPGDPGWDRARAAWNLAVDQRPDLVVEAADAEDVVTIVRYAAASGLRVAPQATGHNAGPLGDLTGTVLLRMSSMRGVTVDPVARRARVEAGATWADVVGPAGEHGLAALAGSSHDVGVAGYCVGGGLSWLARGKGLACNSVVGLEVVTADGIVRRVDGTAHPELFWALRGGGGSYAVVTALELQLYPVPEVYAGAMFWPFDRAGEVWHAYREWTRELPTSVTSCVRLLQLPPLPEIPEFLRGQSFSVVEVAADLPAEDAEALVRPLRELSPTMDTCATIPSARLLELHMDPPEPVPGAAQGASLAEMPEAAVDAILGVAGPGSGSPLLSLEVRQLGGALAEAHPSHGALSHLDGEFVAFGVGITPSSEAFAAVDGHLDVVMTTLEPWCAERTYHNFVERSTDGPHAFHADETVERLRTVKAQFDAGDLIRANHPVRPVTG